MAVSPYGSVMSAPATLAERVIYYPDGSYTFNKADYPGLKYVRVRCVGGGGGSGGANDVGSGVAEAGGGGGGGYSESIIYAAELGASETITVGAGGAAGVVGVAGGGGAGGTSSFGVHLSATGGGGGSGMDSTTGSRVAGGGAPGSGSGGTVNADGSRGGLGIVLTGLATRTNDGGGSLLSGEQRTSAGGATSGSAGNRYGGGASGAIAAGADMNGAVGSSGVVIVDVYEQEQGLIGDTGFVHPNQFSKGLLGFGEATADQGPFSAETALTGLSVAVTVPAGRRVKVTASTFPMPSGSAGGRARIRIYRDSTHIKMLDTALYSKVNFATGLETTVIDTPPAGTYTYKVHMVLSDGTNQVTNVANPTYPSQLIVEDVGPA